MRKTKARRLPFAGTLPRTETEDVPFPGQKRNSHKSWGEDDPLIQRAYKLGAPKKSELARLHTERDPETAIRTTAKALQDTPFRKWSPELMQDAKKFLDPQIVAAIIKEQQQKKVK